MQSLPDMEAVVRLPGDQEADGKRRNKDRAPLRLQAVRCKMVKRDKAEEEAS